MKLMRAEAVEPGRLRRAAHLAVRREGPRQFAVRGQKEEWYFVDLDGDPMCYCADSENRSRKVGPCKHVLASLMASGDMRIINALAALYEPQVRAEREMGLTTEGEE